MYGSELTDSLSVLRVTSATLEQPYWILDASLGCFLEAATAAMNGRITPAIDFVGTSVRLLIITDAISREPTVNWGGAQYLLGLAYEQSAFVISSIEAQSHVTADPLDNNEWTRILLASLHYLAGGFRVQAVAAVRRLKQIADRSRRSEYSDAVSQLHALFDGRSIEGGSQRWRRVFFGDLDLPNAVEAVLNRLARQVRAQRGIALSQLGRDEAEEWLMRRGIEGVRATTMWRGYLGSLESRGIVSFTKEQFGAGFDTWLRLQPDLLVVLPTGAGKSLIGELRTALTLAAGYSCVWIQPTRALVRQSQRELRRAFRPVGIEVEELPTSDDAAALFSDDFDEAEPVVATTTPERLSAMLRSNPTAMQNVRLLVMDEAQLLCTEQRGVTAEHVLAEVRQIVPDCRIVLMTAFADMQATLQSVLTGLGQSPQVLSSSLRPTRRVYGVLRAHRVNGHAELQVLAYPPRPDNEDARNIEPFVLRLPDRSHVNGRTATDTAQRFASLATNGGLRTVVFVNQKRSTESQAEKIASHNPRTYTMPGQLISRLQLELGRPSFLEAVAPFAVSPHHAGLSTLEQHLVEQLIDCRHVLTVIATPTLAQGVNLPLDVAVVTFTQRRSETGETTDLSEAEVRNMLGRAGRAGMVPDGICLIARKESGLTPSAELINQRRWFFSHPNELPAPGIVSLLRRAREAGVDRESWIDDMAGLRFSESQALLSMVARRLQQSEVTDLAGELARYPSFRALPANERALLSDTVSALATNVARRLQHTAVLEIVARSGMPIPFVETIRNLLATVTNSDAVLDSDWWDSAIGTFLERGMHSPWVRELLGPFSAQNVMRVVHAWRRGDPVSSIEQIVPTESARRTRIQTGQYLNHSISLLAQLWAIGPLSVEAFDTNVDPAGLRHFAACVRDGVPDLDALVWLRALGGMDRVLATALGAEAILPDSGGYYLRRRVAGDLLERWRRGEECPLRGAELSALFGILEESELLGAV